MHINYKVARCSAAGNCAQVGLLEDGDVVVGNTKSPEYNVRFSPMEWDSFVAETKVGAFDRSSLPGPNVENCGTITGSPHNERC